MLLLACVALSIRPCRGFRVAPARRTAAAEAARVRLSSSSASDDGSSATSSPSPSPSVPSPDGRARLLFLGTPDVAASSLRTLHDRTLTDPACPYRIVGAVTQPPKRRKRRGKSISSPVGAAAEELGIEVLTPERARDEKFLEEVEEMDVDVCVTAAYGQYLPKRFLRAPKFGTLNIHPSLLPRWRGSSPVQRSLEAGDNPVGVSVLFTVSKMDAGPIVAQESLEIDENESATTLLPTLFEMGTALLVDALPKVIEGEIDMETATAQDEALATEAGMIDSSEGQLWPRNMTAAQCHNRVRGFSMWPGTFLYFRIGDDESKEPTKVKVIESRVLPEKAEPTDAIEIGPKKGDGLRLVCGDGSVLEMIKVQPATRNVMDAKSFVNGLQGQKVRWVGGSEE
ncbi:hypothetical protein ACHAWF_012420 [Thalassiosira exigua]